ncbi:MAG TPA: FGGY-family carbohydrate kinase [Pyrinomonadaceae bacterium]|nr:FGGY-family carbohydrate kinase [Pyrinomonadaceae bacterium]
MIIGGALSDGGGLFRWLKDNLRLSGTDDEVEAEIGRREPDAHGLTFLPFLFGERSTGYHENARGAILGLQSTTDSIDIVQAGLESVAYRFAEIFDRLNEVCKIKEIIASGGALRESPVWTQIIADVLGRDMFLPDTREASSRGAVVFALGLSNRPHDSKAPDGTRFEFDTMRRITYLRSRGRHRHFYDTLTSAS